MAIFDFIAIRKTLSDFSNELSSVRLAIEKNQREIEDVEFAPAAHEDIVAALKTWSTSQQQVYDASIMAVTARLAQQPDMLSNSGKVAEQLRFGAFLQEPVAARMSLDTQLCGLLGADRFTELFAAKIASMNLPPAGLPAVQRAQRVNDLKAKQVTLVKKEASLVEAAEKAGLNIS